MQDVVRLYEFTYADGRKVVCVTDLLNIVLFPETGRENRLVEYGRHGQVEDEFDYEVQPAFLELGDRTLMRPIQDMDSYDVWPDLDHVPTVTRRHLLRTEEFEAAVVSYREQLYAHRAARKHIEHTITQAIEAFRKTAMREQKAKIAELGPPPTFEDLVEDQLQEG